MNPESGTNFGTNSAYLASANPWPDPSAYKAQCGPVSATVYDLNEFQVTLNVPAAATRLGFDFNYLTADYPDVCATWSDRFVVLAQSGAGPPTNIAFDGLNHPVSSSLIFSIFTALCAS